MSSVTTDDRLQRLGAILTELTESIQTKRSSCSELREPDARKRENQPSRTANVNNKKRNYIPFDDSIMTPDAVARFYTIRFNLENKRKTNPYALRNEIAEITGSPPKRLTTSEPELFAVEVRSAEQGNKVLNLNSIKNLKCECEKHPYLNQSKGLIYVYEYDIDDLNKFTLGLQENYKI